MTIGILLTLFVAAQTYAQPGKLIDAGSVYPNRYLPLDPEKWLSGKRATLRTYDENWIEVLWIEPQKSTKATK